VMKSSAGPTHPPRAGPIPRCSPMACAMVSSPNTKKLTCWTHPFGPTSSALTGSATGLNSSRRSASCAKNATVKRTGPTMPAQARAGNADPRRVAAGARLLVSQG
jgi:hypothetical protein